MSNISISYCFNIKDKPSRRFEVIFDSESVETSQQSPNELPEWTRLDYFQCSHCPLNKEEHPTCPVAANLVRVTVDCDFLISYDKIEMEVTTSERHVTQDTTAQSGISSLIGLLMATSGCPHTVFFKPMARFHLPLASEEETIYRASSMYSLAQYFKRCKGEDADSSLDGLKKIYDNIHTMNIGIANRLKSIAHNDASINAIVILDIYSQTMPEIIEDKLDEIDHLFAPYLK